VAGALDSKTVVSDWLSGLGDAFEVALWLTMLPCAESGGRFGDEWMSMTMSFGSEAKGAARASAGDCSMLNQKNRFCGTSTKNKGKRNADGKLN